MKRYIKNGIIKFRNQIVLHGTKTITDRNGNEKVVKVQIISPKEEQLLADGWVEYIPPVIEDVPQDASNNLQNSQNDIDIPEEEYTPIPNDTVLEVPQEISDKTAFVRARHRLRNNIQKYDSSSEVNCFYIGETPIWLDKATRSGLMLRFESELKLGDKHTTLWYNGIQYPLELAVALNMLYMIEKYASQCYDNTQYHLAEIAKLTTIEELQSYDYKSGYPEKLRF